MVMMKKKAMVLWCWLMVAAVSFLAGATTATELQRFEQPSKGDGTLSFLVVGDWGRSGDYNQSLVAHQMGIVGEKLDIDFVVSTGDNFYDDGLKSEDDPAFLDSFSNIYTANSLQKQWYSVLGNHDYRGDAEAQMSPLLQIIDKRWLCLRSFIVNAGIAELFFVDTTPFVNDYIKNPENHQYDWRGVMPHESYTSQLLWDLENALSKSTAKWKFVIGHHAIRSIGHHGDTPELKQRLLPILQANNVDLYINGHDHCLEHISDDQSQIQFLTSGAGSKAWRGDVKDSNSNDVKFFYDGQGFMSIKLTFTDLEVVFYDVFGAPIHKWTISMQLHSAM